MLRSIGFARHLSIGKDGPLRTLTEPKVCCGAARRTGRSLQRKIPAQANSHIADKTDFGYSHFFDAAFIRRHGTLIAAAQCMSSNQSLTIAHIAFICLSRLVQRYAVSLVSSYSSCPVDSLLNFVYSISLY